MRGSKRFVGGLAVGVLSLLASAAWAADEAEGGFVSLFDGRSLDGWQGKPQFWSVRDDVITGQTTAENPTKGNTFLIWRGGKLADFELRLQFRMVGGNSGIQYRSTEYDDFVVGGYQADFDASGRYVGILYEERGRGILALRGQRVTIGADGAKTVAADAPTCDEKAVAASIQNEGWNDYTIIARGNHLVHKVNGFTTVDVTDNQSDKGRVDGILALQVHAGPPMLVQFREIRLKQLQ